MLWNFVLTLLPVLLFHFLLSLFLSHPLKWIVLPFIELYLNLILLIILAALSSFLYFILILWCFSSSELTRKFITSYPRRLIISWIQTLRLWALWLLIFYFILFILFVHLRPLFFLLFTFLLLVLFRFLSLIAQQTRHKWLNSAFILMGQLRAIYTSEGNESCVISHQMSMLYFSFLNLPYINIIGCSWQIHLSKHLFIYFLLLCRSMGFLLALECFLNKSYVVLSLGFLLEMNLLILRVSSDQFKQSLKRESLESSFLKEEIYIWNISSQEL